MRDAAAATEQVAADTAATSGDGEESATIDLLDVCEAIGTHFHEHHDAIVAWSWKLFCVKWARMTVQVATQERDRRAREREREQEQRARDLRERARAGGW